MTLLVIKYTNKSDSNHQGMRKESSYLYVFSDFLTTLVNSAFAFSLTSSLFALNTPERWRCPILNAANTSSHVPHGALRNCPKCCSSARSLNLAGNFRMDSATPSPSSLVEDFLSYKLSTFFQRADFMHE